MAVYVDKPVFQYGRMKMCHMLADNTSELLKMADQIGVDRRWIQKPGTPGEHFDICQAKRITALENGANEISHREIASIIQKKEKGF